MYSNLVNHGNSVNPFLTLMYYRISFNTWLNATKREREVRDTPFFTEKIQPPEIEVFIEIEETLEFTSEESDESTPLVTPFGEVDSAAFNSDNNRENDAQVSSLDSN